MKIEIVFLFPQYLRITIFLKKAKNFLNNCSILMSLNFMIYISLYIYNNALKYNQPIFTLTLQEEEIEFYKNK